MSFSKNHQHLVFSTAGRRRTIDKAIQRNLWAYLAGICRNHGMFVNTIGGTEDHVHLLIELPPILSIAKAVLLIKSNSSKWMKEKRRGFAWQKGYGSFSVSASNVRTVLRYIDNQEAHHRRMSFEDEFLRLLKRHRVEFDPKHVFD
jgi:REP-associated tyrosine transposase